MIDVMMITKDESLNVPYSLKALEGWTNRVFLVDSGSTDGTQDIARSFGAEVVHHDWPGYAKQKNWGIDNLPVRIGMGADHRCRRSRDARPARAVARRRATGRCAA